MLHYRICILLLVAVSSMNYFLIVNSLREMFSPKQFSLRHHNKEIVGKQISGNYLEYEYNRYKFQSKLPSLTNLYSTLSDSANVQSSSDIASLISIDQTYTDKIGAIKFHHIEFYCGDAVMSRKRFQLGLGANFVAKSDQSTGNNKFASYVIQTGEVRMAFTAPYGDYVDPTRSSDDQGVLVNNFNKEYARNFFVKHGLAVRAVCIEVVDVFRAYEVMIENGGKSVTQPIEIFDEVYGRFKLAEVVLYGDVILRIIDKKDYLGVFLPTYQPINEKPPTLPFLDEQTTNEVAPETLGNFKIRRFDHIVGNLWSLQPTKSFIQNITGFHEFAEFVAEDVGTVDSGLNSVVLANSNEMILLPLNEPTFGTKRKSQIQTYLEQNQGEGVQHIALMTSDIFHTISNMKKVSYWGGFEFMDPPNSEYYKIVRSRLGSYLTEEQYQLIEKYGILADRDKEGTLLQIFTKPLGDRATVFIEIIQRIGCDAQGKPQKPGCGGFGKGNFRDLFKSIEEYEKKLKI